MFLRIVLLLVFPRKLWLASAKRLGKPGPCKNKGMRYSDEWLRKKAGKMGAK
jgi:hypothetical protein